MASKDNESEPIVAQLNEDLENKLHLDDEEEVVENPAAPTANKKKRKKKKKTGKFNLFHIIFNQNRRSCSNW